MIEKLSARYCQNCDRPIRGRSDKKYCSDACRNTFNNQIKEPGTNTVRNINNALNKNRRILKGLFANGEPSVVCAREKLQSLGFQFRYVTHLEGGEGESTCFFCYDHGYLSINGDSFLIVRNAE